MATTIKKLFQGFFLKLKFLVPFLKTPLEVIPNSPDYDFGSLAVFRYSAPLATDPSPFILFVNPNWFSKDGQLYITGIALHKLDVRSRYKIIKTAGKLKPGAISYKSLAKLTQLNLGGVVRTYNTKYISGLHIIGVSKEIL